MVTINDVTNALEQIAPLKLAESWDNCGLIIGRRDKKINKVLLSLDFTDEVLEEAISINAQMIINHHPAIFKGIQKINSDTKQGERLLKCIENSISVYASHTNLDVSQNGTNDTIFNMLSLTNREILDLKQNCEDGLIRTGKLKNAMTLKEFAVFVKEKLNSPFVTYGGEENSLVKKVAIGTGSCGKGYFFNMAKKAGADVFLTGDVTHHSAQEALDTPINIVDATHYFTEVHVLKTLYDYLTDLFDIEFVISSVNGQFLQIV